MMCKHFISTLTLRHMRRSLRACLRALFLIFRRFPHTRCRSYNTNTTFPRSTECVTEKRLLHSSKECVINGIRRLPYWSSLGIICLDEPYDTSRVSSVAARTPRIINSSSHVPRPRCRAYEARCTTPHELRMHALFLLKSKGSAFREG